MGGRGRKLRRRDDGRCRAADGAERRCRRGAARRRRGRSCLRGFRRHFARRPRRLPARHRGRNRRAARRDRPPRRGRVRTARGAAGGRDRPHHRPVAAVRRPYRGGAPSRPAPRPGAARPQARAPPRPAAGAAPAWACCGVRRLELPARLLDRGRRHGVGAGGGLPGHRQGSPGPSRHVRAGRGRDPRRNPRDRHAGGRVRAVAGRQQRPGSRRGAPSAHQGDRLHRQFRRGAGALRPVRRAARADPVLWRAWGGEPRLRPARSRRRARGRDRRGLGRVADDGGGPVLHQPRRRFRDRR